MKGDECWITWPTEYESVRVCELRWSVSLSRRTAVSVRHKASYPRMQLLRVAWALTGAAICCFLILLIHSRLLKEGNHAELHQFACHFYAVLMRRRLPCSLYEVFRNNKSNAECVRRFSAIAIRYGVFLSVAIKWKSSQNSVETTLKQISLHEAQMAFMSFDFPHRQFTLSTSHSPEDDKFINFVRSKK